MVNQMSNSEPHTYAAEKLVDIFEGPNPIPSAHKKALDFQHFLRGTNIYIGDIEPLIKDVEEELNATCGHKDMPIKVLGSTSVISLDPRGVNLEEKSFDTDAIVRFDHTFDEEVVATSQGYIVEKTPFITISHLAQASFQTLLQNAPHDMNIARDSRLLIPIDGSVHVKPAVETTVRLDLLEYFIPETLAEIEAAISSGNDLTQRLRALSAVNLENCSSVFNEIDSVAYHLSKHIAILLDTKPSLPYAVFGTDEAWIKTQSGKYVVRALNPSQMMIGEITTINVANGTDRILLATEMPFDDGLKRQVLYPLNPSIVAALQPSFRADGDL